MSLLGSLTTAVSGLNAQSQALSNISGNVANSQTTGFKRLDTTFEDMVTQSASLDILSGGVKAENVATTGVQGAFEQVENPLALALGGRGFFSVARSVARAPDGTQSFDARPTYTRAGDFRLDRDGYMVNSAGYALRGWMAGAGGTPDQTQFQAIRVDRGVAQPQPTQQVTLSANLPSQPSAGAAMSTTTDVFDSLGNRRPLTLSWQQDTTALDAAEGPDANRWKLTVTSSDLPAGAPPLGTFYMLFNGTPQAAGDPLAGTLRAIATDPAALYDADGKPVSPAPGGPASVSLGADFGAGPQALSLGFGSFGSSGGLTQFAGSEYALRSIAQDGAPAGAFASLSIRDTGEVVANYDNGQSRVIARVPVVTFANPDALERLDGQAFAATEAAGPATVTEAGRNGAGTISVGAVERSNVDIAAEFSKLIVAQRAYTANTRIVTTADEMLQETINMRR